MTTLAAVHGYGVLSARPAAGMAGRRYYATDTQLEYRDNGATWDTLTQAGGGGATGALVLIEEQILGVAANDIRLPASGSLPTAYRDLVVCLTGRTNKAGQNYDGVRCRINGDTGNNYDSNGVFHVGGVSAPGVSSTPGASAWIIGFVSGDGNSAGRAGAIEAIISDYARTQWNKVFRSTAARGEPAVSEVEINAGSWRFTAAITDLLLYPVDGTQFLAGTVATIYGRG